MGIEYIHYVIPQSASFLPAPSNVSHLVEQLAKDGWIATPGSESFAKMTFQTMRPYQQASRSGVYARTSEGEIEAPFPLETSWLEKYWDSDLLLCWPVESLAASQLRYPLQPAPPYSIQDIYFEIQMHFSVDYLYRCSEIIAPFDETDCACGESLEYWPDEKVFFGSRLRRSCPKCGRPFDPSDLLATYTDAWTGDESEIEGGATSRFAFAVDCNRCIPHEEWGPQLHPELLSICQETLGCNLREVGDYY